MREFQIVVPPRWYRFDRMRDDRSYPGLDQLYCTRRAGGSAPYHSAFVSGGQVERAAQNRDSNARGIADRIPFSMHDQTHLHVAVVQALERIGYPSRKTIEPVRALLAIRSNDNRANLSSWVFGHPRVEDAAIQEMPVPAITHDDAISRSNDRASSNVATLFTDG